MKTCCKCRGNYAKHAIYRTQLRDIEFSSDSFLKNGLESNFGICDVSIDYFDANLIITFNPAIITTGQIAQALRAPGFKLKESSVDIVQRFILCHINVLRLTVAGVLVLASWVMRFFFPDEYNIRLYPFNGAWPIHISYIFVNMMVICIAMQPRLLKGYRALRRGRYSVEMFTLVAIGGAVLSGFWLEAATFSLVAVFIDAFEEIIAAQTWHEYLNGTIANAKNAYVIEGNATRKIPISKLKAGQKVSVQRGMLIPVDGRIVSGKGHVDESSITGESNFFKKGTGDRVYAGTLLESGSMIIEAIQVGHNTMVAGISRLISSAQQEKVSQMKKIVDTGAAWLSLFTLSYAVFTFLYLFFVENYSIYGVLSFCLSIIFVACPTALLLSAPLAIHAGVGLAAKFGIIFRNGQVMEDFAKTKVLLVDKTGTLTYASSEVSEMELFNGADRGHVLEAAMAIEKNSYHPLALALCSYADSCGTKAVRVEKYLDLEGGASGLIDGQNYYIGAARLFEKMDYAFSNEVETWRKNADGRGCETVLLANEKEIIGGFAFVDKLREECPEVIKRLRELGMDLIIMVTGDSVACARRISDLLKLDDFKAECFPESKLQHLLEIKARENVAMIGDGINDAPAMAASTVGIVMVNTGTDAAIAAADIVLSGNSLDDLVLAYDLSKKVYRTIKFNIALSIVLVIMMLTLVTGKQLSLTESTLLYLGSSLLILVSSYLGLILTFPWIKRLGRRAGR